MSKIFKPAALVATLALVIASTTTSLAQTTIQVELRNAINIHADHQLFTMQQAAERDMRASGRYFGAMFVNPARDRFYLTDDHHSIDDAVEIARIGCTLRSEAGDPPCVLHATVRPRGGTASSIGDISHQLAASIQSVRSELLPGSFSAIFVSRGGGWGLGVNQQTAQLATERAHENCRLDNDPANRQSYIFSYDGAVYEALRRRGFFNCEARGLFQFQGR